MTGLITRLTPDSLPGYQPAWLRTDIVAGVTLAAVAIPETMGYTSIAQVPVVTGLYTVIFPALLFALLGSSRPRSSAPIRRPRPSCRPDWPAWASPGSAPTRRSGWRSPR
jgi:Sulfate permease family